MNKPMRRMASTALDDVTVLDLTRVRAGPTCVRQLADWGAKVIKIEMPEEGGSSTQTDFSARHEADFQNLHRNKRSMTLNLKSPDGLEVLRRMVKQADVIVENYRPDVKTRLGIGYDALDAVNPRLIYASISGFGQDGPVSVAAGRRPDRPGHVRADVDHRRAGARADAGRHRARGSYRPVFSPPWEFLSRCTSASARAAANGCRRRCCRRRSSCSISRPPDI